MRRTAIALIGLVLAGWGAPLAHAQAAPPDLRDDDLPHGGGIIRGRITAADSGTPIPGATVQALLTSLTASPVTTQTDGDGAFELRGLAPGRWRIDAARAGFLSRSFGQRSRSPRVGTITLKDRDIVTANITLTRGGIVSGRILDEFGEPAVDIRVQVMELTAIVNGQYLTPAGVADITDDTGAFRVYNLPPGEYVVSARQQTEIDRISGRSGARPSVVTGAAAVAALEAQRRRAMVSTYFPGTTEIAAAGRIVLGAGEERRGLDFILSPSVPVRVSGVILDSSGKPPTGRLSVVLFSDFLKPGAAFGVANPINTGPAFDFRDVPPGAYFLNVSATGSADGTGPEFADVPITVGHQDITGLTIVTGPGSVLTGTVVSDSGAPPGLNGTRLVAVRGERRPLVANASVAVIDESFRMPNLLGELRLALQGLPAGWSVKAIEIDGQDVMDTPFSFRSGQKQATVTVTNRLTDLTGVVTRDRRPVDAEVVIFPDDPAKWTFQRFVHTIRADEQGRFSVQGLPPLDRYFALATDFVEPTELQKPEFFERLRGHATPFSLDEGQARRLSLAFVERSTIDGR